MREGEGLLSQLPSLDRLREACKRAREGGGGGGGRGTAAATPIGPTWRLLEALVGRSRFGYLNVNLCVV